MDPIDRLKVSTYSRVPSSLERSFFGAFIAELKRERLAQQLTIEALEHKLGVADGLVAKWETFQRLPGAFMLCCWCNSLGLSLTTMALKIEEQQCHSDTAADHPPQPLTPQRASRGPSTTRRVSGSKVIGARRKPKRRGPNS